MSEESIVLSPATRWQPLTQRGETALSTELSELYTVETGINPLVSSAQPLLSIIQRLKLTHKINKTSRLGQQIQHELSVFSQRALETNLGEETVLVGKYLLSAVIDERLSQLTWTSIHDYLAIGRFTPPSIDGPQADERFFTILDGIVEHPQAHLELLELAYLCLNTGFEGKFRESVNKREALDALCEKLYKLIKEQRGFERNQVLIKTHYLRRRLTQWPPIRWGLYSLAAGLICLSTWWGLNQWLSVTADTLVQEILQQ